MIMFILLIKLGKYVKIFFSNDLHEKNINIFQNLKKNLYFFSHIAADASTEYNNLENMDQWTKESLIGLSVIGAFCLILGCLLIFVS